MRRLGVYNESLPTKKSLNVEPSDFLIGGVIGFFERKFARSFLVRNPEEAREIFGDHVIPTYYGWDALRGFFDNVRGVDAKIYVKSHVGNAAGVIDAVVATKNAVDGAAADTLKFEAAYKEELEYGVSGNRTGFQIVNGSRFTTAIKTASNPTDLFVYVDSVADIKVGDILKVIATAGGGATVYKKITAVDESLGKVSFADAFHGTASPDVDDVVTIPGFKILPYRKTLKGVEYAVDTDLAEQWLTLESDVSDYYVENVFSRSKWLKVTALEPGTAVGSTYFPIDVSTTEYLESGANGTSPTTTAQWEMDLDAMANDPYRIICNPETTDEEIQKAIETYNRGRNDTPKVIYNLPEDQDEDQLSAIGGRYQRSDDVLGILPGNWLEKADPFATSALAPKRSFPSCGSVMGLWIRSIGINGIHWVPAVSSMPIYGASGVVGDTFLNDLVRTSLAERGINVIQNIPGTGIVLKNFFTPSTTKEFKFGNGIIMREFIKLSVRDSLAPTENEPNTFARIQSSRSAVVNFLYGLWERGSTGNVSEGETFGQTENEDTGEPTKPEDHFQVQADAVNNPQSDIEDGERNVDSWFTYPSPAGSIKIGVGLMLLG